jgi:putative endonuclease
MAYVYILSNTTHTTVYVGVTNDLVRRIYEHRNDLDPNSFSARYKVHDLVYFEELGDIYEALSREKQIKGWNRARKNRLVESKNPMWRDLYISILP